MTAAALKQALDPLAFYQWELPGMPTPRRRGWVDGGLCPFHEDRNRGNFRVNIDNGRFCCFACGVRGADVIAFAQRRHGLPFLEALRYLENLFT